MSSALTLTLVLAVLCTGGFTVQYFGTIAPFTFSKTSNTYQYFHHLSCSHDQNVFIRSLENGYKQRECQCDKDKQCCQVALNDCRQDMSPDILQQVTEECWDKRECRPLVTKPKDSCWKDGVEFRWPTYSWALFDCVSGDTVVDMTKQTSVSGDVVTVRALPAGLPHSHTVTCSVQAVGGGQKKVGLFAVISQGASPMSCLSVGTETLCPLSPTAKRIGEDTPFNISLQQPAHSSLHYAWVYMQVSEGEIRVSCGQRETTPSSTRAGTGSEGVTSTSVPVSSSMLSDAASPTMETVVGLAAGLAGLVVALAASWVFFLVWRRRQTARRTGQKTQPDQGGHIVLAELATARSDVTYESLRTEGGYQRLALPGRVVVPARDVTSVGQDDYDDFDVVDVTEEDPNDVSRLERESQGVEEGPYDVKEPSYVNEDVTTVGQND